MKFTEAKLEEAIIALLGEQGFPHVSGTTITRAPEEVLIKDDLRAFLRKQYAADEISEGEINTVIAKLEGYVASDLYASNKAIMKLVCDGFLLKREDLTGSNTSCRQDVLLLPNSQTFKKPPIFCHKKTLQFVTKID